MKLHIRIFFGYIILMAVIGSMTAILVHERGRMREIELESVEIRKIRQGISTAIYYRTCHIGRRGYQLGKDRLPALP